MAMRFLSRQEICMMGAYPTRVSNAHTAMLDM
jgi:hypothetical protein